MFLKKMIFRQFKIYLKNKQKNMDKLRKFFNFWNILGKYNHVYGINIANIYALPEIKNTISLHYRLMVGVHMWLHALVLFPQ